VHPRQYVRPKRSKFGARIQYAVPAYCMRSLNLECVIRILYAAPASSMRHPHIVCGHRILYAVHALCMRRPHIVFGKKKGYVKPHPKPHTICRISINPRMRFAFYIKKICVHILYAVPAYSMRDPHTVCGTAYSMRDPHTVCGTAYRMRSVK
jgi:hypothetical protein